MGKYFMILTSLFFIFILSACGDKGLPFGLFQDDKSIEIKNFESGFTDNRDFIDNPKYDELNFASELEVGNEYLLIYSMVINPSEIDSQEKFKLEIEFSQEVELETIESNVKKASGIDIPFKPGSGEGQSTKEYSVDLDIEEEEVELFLAINMEPLHAGSTGVSFDITTDGDSEDVDVRSDDDDITLNVTIDSVKNRLKTPDISPHYNSDGSVSLAWEHVEHAESYEIYERDELYDTVDASDYSPGSVIEYNDFSDIESEFADFRIKAIDKDDLFISSYRSEGIEIKVGSGS